MPERRNESSAARTLPPTPGVAAMAAMFPQPVARPPVRCPICYGKTTVPSGFYEDESTTSALPVKCRSCGGRGIV